MQNNYSPFIVNYPTFSAHYNFQTAIFLLLQMTTNTMKLCTLDKICSDGTLTSLSSNHGSGLVCEIQHNYSTDANSNMNV